MVIFWKRVVLFGVLSAVGTLLSSSAFAGDLRIRIPKRSHLTPVQRLNREGVDAVKRNRLDKAKELFFRAYLFDPGDPFTLNNLGYVSELEGQVERAEDFYSLASAQATEARIDRASSAKLEGESLQSAISTLRDVSMRVNRANVEAVRLLSKGRLREADELLRRTLDLDPRNGFTLNNMGVAKEAQGDYGEALNYYNAAANLSIKDPVVVTMNAPWRGKPLSEMAHASAAKLASRMQTLQSTDAQVAVLNLRGVSAMNRNDWREASQDFSQAFKLGPDNAFSLNNRGYMAEIDGDLESAEEFYRLAREAGGTGTRVGLATRPGAEGMRLFAVAEESEGQVLSAIEIARQARRRHPGPIQLIRRDGSPVVTSSTSPQSATPPQ